MGKVNPGSLKDWRDGDVVMAADYKQERELLRVAINDNFDRLIKQVVVQNANGQTKSTANLDEALNILRFKEGANVTLSLDPATATLTIAVTYENSSVGTAAIADGAVTTVKVANSAINTIKIANNAVTEPKIANNAVSTRTIQNGSVTEPKMSDNSISTRTIQSKAVTEGKLNDAAVITRTIADRAVSTAKLADRSVTEAKIQVGALDNRYYTESEVDAKLANKTDKTGDHQGTWHGLRVEDIDPDGFDAARITALEKRLDDEEVRDFTISNRLSVVHTDQATPLHITKLEGRTVVNRLGKQGNFYNAGDWTWWGGSRTVENNVLTLTGNGSSNIPQIMASGGIGNVPSVGDALLLRVKITARTEGIKSLRTYLYRDGYGRFGEKVIDLPTPNKTYHLVSAFPVTQSLIDAWDKTDPSFGVRVAFTTEDAASAEGKSVDIEQVALYDIPSADVSLDEAALDAKYPYVDSMQNLSGFYLKRYGKNLFNAAEFVANNSSHYTMGADSSSIVKPAGVLDNRAWNNVFMFRLLPNTTYTLSVGTPSVPIQSNNNATSNGHGGNSRVTFTTDAAGLHGFKFAANIPEEVVVTDIMLNIGAEPLPFEPQNNDYLYADVELASNTNGTVKDVLEYRDGRYWKVKQFNQVVLDGRWEWTHAGSYDGFRTIRIPKGSGFAQDREWSGDGVVGVKYDGSILNVNNASLSPDTIGIGVWSNPNEPNSDFLLSVKNYDAGWDPDVNPNSNAIKAFLNGWRAITDNGTKYTHWVSILNPNPNNVVTDEDYVASVKAPGWTGWATLQYQLADSVVEEVTDKVEGAISLYEGDNQVEMGEAVVVREKITAFNGIPNGYAEFNHITLSPLNYPAKEFIQLYENDSHKKINVIITGTHSYGKVRGRISPIELYDPSATYTITYIAEPYQLSSAAQSVDVQYTANVKTALDRNIQDVADLSTRVSTFPSIYARKHQEQWIQPTLLNGWSGVARYYKDELGTVHVMCSISGGIAMSGAVLFVLPEGYRPDISPSRTFVAYTNTSAPTPDIAFVDVHTDGRVRIASSEFKNPTFAFSISFRAR